MKTENIENQAEENIQESQIIQTEESPNENFLSELHAPVWAVVSFEKVVEGNLTYDKAVRKMQELIEQKVSGLCIITENAAQKIAE
ncbi:MAG: hypothetical protein ACR2J3_06120 [Aridibacter sp.]